MTNIALSFVFATQLSVYFIQTGGSVLSNTHMVQLNANLTPAGKQPAWFGTFTCTRARHVLPVTSYKHY